MEFPLTFRCDECGRDLRGEFVQDYKGENIVHIEPCQWCLDSARDEEHDHLKEWWGMLKEI